MKKMKKTITIWKRENEKTNGKEVEKTALRDP